MALDDSKALESFLHFFGTFNLSRPTRSVADLGDGAACHEILSIVDSQYFGDAPASSTESAVERTERLASLKRLYRLLMQYYGEVLGQPTARLDVPDLEVIAKGHDTTNTLTLCKLALAAAVQSERKKEVIERIQKLGDADQHNLMKAIEQVMSKLNQPTIPRSRAGSMTEDDHYYQLQAERNRLASEKESLQQRYEEVQAQLRTTQSSLEDATAEKDDALNNVKEMRGQLDSRRDERADASMKAEIDNLRLALQKTEENLNVAEAELEKQTATNSNLSRQVDELQISADEAVRLKDQVDELRHGADKLQKMENVMEKYKKKLEETADLRRRIKSLEEQNSSVIDKNAALEEDYRKFSTYKPLIESYKSQIADFETKTASRSKEFEATKFELEETKARLRIEREEKAKDAESSQLYQERLRELELRASKSPKSKPLADENRTGAEPLGDDIEDPTPGTEGEVLEDAMRGTTMTELKLQIHRLERELQDIKTNHTDKSRTLVLESLLEDANRMKTRYQQDYLEAHRARLLLQSNLEEIRSGKAMGDGAEAAIALRQRLNETVDALDALNKEHAELEVKFQQQSKELVIAKSDLNLVNKDQVDILATLRESVNEDKVGLQKELAQLRDQIMELKEKNRMQLEQVNTLLVDKVGLQFEGIEHRERMLERERNFSDLRASISGKDLPEDVKSRLLSMHEDNVQLKEAVKTTSEKLAKARAFIKNQDQLYKAESAAKSATSTPTSLAQVEEIQKQMRVKDDEIERLKTLQAECAKHFQKELQQMLSLLHKTGMKVVHDHVAGQKPNSWMRQQRVTQRSAVQRT